MGLATLPTHSMLKKYLSPSRKHWFQFRMVCPYQNQGSLLNVSFFHQLLQYVSLISDALELSNIFPRKSKNTLSNTVINIIIIPCCKELLNTQIDK